MNDMSSVIVPKSDQLNADDLISGPLTITISAVEIRPGTEQPVTIRYEGDGGRPWKPCKSMCRVMVAVWGRDAKAYVGRGITLVRDPSVKWGGVEVGGIRVSHMSDLKGDMTMALTATKGSRKPYTVRPLVAAGGTKTSRADQLAQDLAERIRATRDMPALQAITADAKVIEQRAWLAEKRPDLAGLVDEAVAGALAAIEAADDFPGSVTPRDGAPA